MIATRAAERQRALVQKKHRLLRDSAALRERLAVQMQPLIPLFTGADRVRAGLLWIRRHPGVPVALATALLVARPLLVLRWAQRGWMLWRLVAPLRSGQAAPQTTLAIPVLTALVRRWFKR
jgi:hypothetical protein